MLISEWLEHGRPRVLSVDRRPVRTHPVPYQKRDAVNVLSSEGGPDLPKNLLSSLAMQIQTAK